VLPREDTAQARGSAAARALERRRNVLLAQHHREQGWSIAQIAPLLDRAPATVRGYLHDPTGEKAKRRKASYAGACERCGAPTSGADGKRRTPRHCQRCKPQSRARWTRELVRGAHRFWRERFGFIASSADWSGTHARRRGGAALERYQSARWPSQSVIRRLYGSPVAARADAFAGSATDHAQPAANARRDTAAGPAPWLKRGSRASARRRQRPWQTTHARAEQPRVHDGDRRHGRQPQSPGMNPTRQHAATHVMPNQPDG
jgi:hypothetical protein